MSEKVYLGTCECGAQFTDADKALQHGMDMDHVVSHERVPGQEVNQQ